MVLPVIAAGAARAAGTSAVRGAASTTANAGTQTAQRASGSAIKKSLQSEGRNIVRARRNSNLSNSFNRNARPSTRSSGPARGRIDSQTKKFVPYDQDDEEEFPQGAVHNKKPKQKMGLLVSGLLLYVAFLTDVLELKADLLGTAAAGIGVLLGVLVDFIRYILFPLIFIVLGAPFWKGKKAKKKLTVMITGALIEIIPWVGAFTPATTISVAITIYLTRQEGKEVDIDKTIESAKKNIVRAKRLIQRKKDVKE